MEQTGSCPDSVVLDVVQAVANETGTDPVAMNPPLQTVIDAEALERLVRGPAVSQITFEYDGHAVAVDGDGSVTVEAASERRTAIESARDEDLAVASTSTAQLDDDASLEEL